MRHPDPDSAFAGLTVEEMKAAERDDPVYSCDEVIVETWNMNASKKYRGSVEIQWDHGTTTSRDLNVMADPELRTIVESLKPPFQARWYGGARLGDRSHGLDVQDPETGEWIEVYYETPLDREATRAKETAGYDRRKRDAFGKERAELDAKFEALPELFRMRIRERRLRQPAFRVDHEGYETFCCQQAVAMAEAALIGSGHEPEVIPADVLADMPAVNFHLVGFADKGWIRNEDGHLGGEDVARDATDWLKRWSEMKHAQQQKAMPAFEGSQHSGNTYGAALHMAVIYLGQPLGIVRQHGALAAIGGSEAYGDPVDDKLRQDFPAGVAWAREDVTA